MRARRNLFIFTVAVSILILTKEACGQDGLCPFVTEETNRFLGGKERKSKEALVFNLSKNLIGGLQFSNLGLPLTIQMSFNFMDSLGYAEEAGQLLTIDFKDGSSQQLMASSKKIYGGTVSFMLIKPKDKHKKLLSYEDMIFFEKLRNVYIESFKLGVADVPRVVFVSTEQGEIIKRIVGCLVE